MTRLAVVGATGAVGRTMLALLRERDFPPTSSSCSPRLARPAQIDGRTVQLLDDRADAQWL